MVQAFEIIVTARKAAMQKWFLDIRQISKAGAHFTNRWQSFLCTSMIYL